MKDLIKTSLCGRASVMALSVALLATANPQTSWAQDEGASGAGLDVITVTARKREETLQDVPIAVSSVSPGQLEKQFATDIEDLEGIVPGLVIDPVGAGPQGGGISIRGVSFEDIEKSFDPAVGVLIDGVYIGTNTGQLLDFFDYQEVSVLRGPQGTLFGKNTTGGVINLVRTRPTGEFGVNAAVNYGSYGRNDYKAVVNVPVAGDLLKAKGFVFWQRLDGFYDNVTRNTSDGQVNFLNYGITLESDLTEGLNVLVTVEQHRDRGETVTSPLSVTGVDLICLFPGVPGFSPADQCDRNQDEDLYTTFTNKAGPIEYDLTAVTGQIQWDIGDFTLKSITGYRSSEEVVAEDFDATSIDFFDTIRPQDYTQISQEITAAGPITEWLYGLAGFYFWNAEYDLFQSVNFGAVLSDPNPPFTLTQTTDHETTAYAGFAEVNVDLLTDLTFTGGVRYTYEEKEITRGNLLGAIQLFEANGSDNWGEVTYRFILDYKLTPDYMVYASYARGFRSGGFNGRAASPTSIGPYDPEFVNTYEVGAKTRLFDNLAQVNGAFFYTEYTDKQEETVQPTPPGAASPQETVVQNAADATIWGIELDFQALVTENLTFRGAFSYIDSEYDSFFSDLNADGVIDPVTEDISTLNLRRAPQVTFAVGADYDMQVGPGELVFSTTFRYVDEYETTINRDPASVPGNFFNDTRGTTEPLKNLSASATYTVDLNGVEWRFSVFGRNILDERGLSSTLPVAGLFTFGSARAPATVGGEIGVRF